MPHSSGETWQRVRSLEELLVLLGRIEDRRRVIRAHAWRQGSASFEQIFLEASAMETDVERLKAALSAWWNSAIAVTRDADT